MQSASSKIWTRITVFIFYDANHYTTGTSFISVCISNIHMHIDIWFHHLDITENFGESSRSGLHKDDASHNTENLQPLISQTIQVRWAMMITSGEVRTLISDILLWTRSIRHTSVGWSAKTCNPKVCEYWVYHLEDFIRMIANRDRQQERV